MSNYELLWRRQAAIKLIVDRLEDTGKTKLQKILYFTQEAIGAPLQYRFRMHHYGPFSQDVEDDISFMKAIGYLDVQLDSTGFGYHIRSASDHLPAWDDEMLGYKDKMTNVIGKLGVLHVNDLELWATIHFVQQLLNEPTRESVIENVRRLKPRFTAEQIGAAYDQLVEADLMAAAPTS